MTLTKRLTALALLTLALTGCVRTSVLAAKSDCSQLIPSAWREGVPNAPAPERKADDLEQLKEWINFGVAQTGQLDKANNRTSDALGIIERCEKRDQEAIQKAKPKFLGLF